MPACPSSLCRATPGEEGEEQCLPALWVAVWHSESSSPCRGQVSSLERPTGQEGQGDRAGIGGLLKHRLLFACARALECNIAAAFIISGGCCEGQHFLASCWGCAIMEGRRQIWWRGKVSTDEGASFGNPAGRAVIWGGVILSSGSKRKYVEM